MPIIKDLPVPIKPYVRLKRSDRIGWKFKMPRVPRSLHAKQTRKVFDKVFRRMLYKYSPVSIDETDKVMDLIFHLILAYLKEEYVVHIANFGTFSSRYTWEPNSYFLKFRNLYYTDYPELRQYTDVIFRQKRYVRYVLSAITEFPVRNPSTGNLNRHDWRFAQAKHKRKWKEILEWKAAKKERQIALQIALYMRKYNLTFKQYLKSQLSVDKKILGY